MPLFELAAPSFTSFSLHDGLPASIMANVAVDNQGFVLAATANSVASYDGSRWEVDTPFARSGTLSTFTVTHDGSLWIAARDNGAARFDGRHWQPDESLVDQSIRRIVETRNADGSFQLLALTMDRGLLKEEKGQWREVPGNDLLPSSLLSVMPTQTVLGKPRLWVGSLTKGLWFSEQEGKWQRFSAEGFDATQIESLLVTHDNGGEQLWISAFGGGLWRLDGHGLRSWTVESGDLPTNSLYTLARSEVAGGDSVIWAASRAGLLRVYKDQVRSFNRSHGLPSDVVRDITKWRSPDGVQVLWLATEGGMARTTADVLPWSTVSLAGAQDTGVFAVFVQASGDHEQLWVGSQGDGLGLFENGRWHKFDESHGLPTANVSMVKSTLGPNGEEALWVGTRNGGLARVLDDQRIESLKVPWSTVAGQTILDILHVVFDRTDETWVATRTSGLYRLRGGNWQAMAPAGAPSEWRSTAVLQQVDSSGRKWLWATSSMGLLRYDGTSLNVALSRENLGKQEVIGMRLFVDSAHSILWIGSNDGIVRVDVSDPMHPQLLANDLPTPPDPFVYDAQRDSKGRIYLCTNNGVQLLIPDAGIYRSRVFTRRDGMPHDECNTNARFIDTHDRYWTGTLGGLGVYDPSVERMDKQAKPLKVTGAWAGNQAIDIANIVLSPDRRSLQVKFALLSWINNDKSQFRTQLLGDELEPTAWSSSNQRSFTHLPPGTFALRIEARDYAGNLSEPIELPITVQPAWWQTLWAKVGSILATMLGVYLLLQWRIRSYKGQRKHLEQQVALRTQELNQANAQLMELSFADPLTGLANRRKFHQVLEDGIKQGKVSNYSLIFIDVDHFKDYNDEFGHPAGDEALRVVAAAMQHCAPPHALLARYGGEEFACLLPNTSASQANEVAQCMRTTTELSKVPVPGQSASNQITISAGIAECEIGKSADYHLLLRNADKALYAAKSAGRNRICISDSTIHG